jgi:hypothetical protein
MTRATLIGLAKTNLCTVKIIRDQATVLLLLKVQPL